MSSDREPNRWMVLALLGLAQLMVVLDATIVNIALPNAQQALHFSATNRQWVITAYSLAFGSLLLFGGKLGDLFGRKWTFVVGLLGFSGASAIGGLAQSFAVLVAARACQGMFGALLAPSALSLLTVTFAGSPDRPKAFGIFSAIAGAGGSIGLLLGGILTQALSWRWCLYVNLLIAIPTAIVALRVLVNVRPPERPRIDFPGLLAATGGLFLLVYGFSSAETSSWGDSVTVLSFVGSVVLLGSFVLLERRVAHPLLPLHIVRDRARGGMYLSIVLAVSGVFGVFIFLTFYMQENLGFSPIGTGLGFIPMNITIILTSTICQTRILPRIGPKALVVFGMTLGAVAMFLFSRIHVGAGYVSHVLPGLILVGLAMGSIFSAAFGTATLGVKPTEAGVASAMVNTSQQVGGSIGVSALSTVFATSAASYLTAHVADGLKRDHVLALVHGYTQAFLWAAGIYVVGLIVAVFVLPPREHLEAVAAAAPGHAPPDAALATD